MKEMLEWKEKGHGHGEQARRGREGVRALKVGRLEGEGKERG